MSKVLFPKPNWSGRFGNNITQLINMLSLGKLFKDSVYIPKHAKLNDTPKIIKYTDNSVSNQSYDLIQSLNIDKKYVYNPFFLGHTKFFRKIITYNHKKDIIKDILNLLSKPKNEAFDDVFNSYTDSVDDLYVDNNALYIHIRSTDIYASDQRSSVVYSQPPISFYNKIIEDHNFKQIYILSDDNNNFVVRQLKNIHRNNCQIVEEKNVLRAYNTLRLAKHVCLSTSSFCTTACFLWSSNSVKHIYGYHYLVNLFHHWFLSDLFGTENIYNNTIDNLNFHIYYIDNYEFMTDCANNNNLYTKINHKNWWKNGNDNFRFCWKFDEETKNLMLTHSTTNIKKII